MEKPACYEFLSRPGGYNRTRTVRRFWITALDHRHLWPGFVHREQTAARTEHSRRAGCAGEAGSLGRARSNAGPARQWVNCGVAPRCRREPNTFGCRLPGIGAGPFLLSGVGFTILLTGSLSVA